MTKKILILALAIMVLQIGAALAADFIIDDFEDGDISKNPKWWTFDKVEIKVDKVIGKGENLGKKALIISGSTKDWYVGGLGTYLGKDGSKFNAVEIRIKGEGDASGQLKIELFDDDNKNWDAEQDPKKGWKAQYDDTWTYYLAVSSKDWKEIIIPFSDFSDSNQGIGNDKLDLKQDEGSGGLLQITLIALSSSQKGKANYTIDEIKLIKQ